MRVWALKGAFYFSSTAYETIVFVDCELRLGHLQLMGMITGEGTSQELTIITAPFMICMW
jgi:hypothetical protein